MSTKQKELIFPKWLAWIKEDKFKDVLFDIKDRTISSKQALEGIVKIGQLAYNHCKKNEHICSSPIDTLNLTTYFNSFFVLDQPKDFIKYLTSIYHICSFFYETNNFEHLMSLFKVVLNFKNSHTKVYVEEGNTLHGPFINLIQRSALKQVNSESPVNTSAVLILLQTFFKLSFTNNVLRDGTSFLQTIFQMCQTLSSKDQKAALDLTTSSLVLLYTVETIQDLDSTLPVLLKVYTSLFQVQLKTTSYRAALCNLESHLNQAKWKYKDDLNQAKCFALLSNVVKILKWDCNKTDTWLLEKIQNNNEILESFRNIPTTEWVKKTCTLMLAAVANFSTKQTKQSVASLPTSCFIPFLRMIGNIANVMKHCEMLMYEIVQFFTEVFVLVSKLNSEEHIDKLKVCVDIVLDIGEEITTLLQKNLTNPSLNVEPLVSMFLSRYSCVILKFHKTELSEEVIQLSKPACKFICSLPPNTYDINNKKKSAKVCFTTLISALGIQKLDQVMECVTMCLSYLPESTDDIFSLLGDMKHNAVAGGVENNLETTIWTVISEKSSTLERDWLPCKLREDEIASFLMLELITYSVNKSLRGKPVIAAAEALMAQKTDVLTQVKALVIVLDVASVSNEFPDHCIKYHATSKALIGKLRKEKANIDPVDYYCWMANLLYMQLRCFLKDLRTSCETDMVRLSVTVAPSNELPEDRPDPNDTCDLNTRYNSLSLAKQRTLLNNDFDSVLRYWGFACSLAGGKEKAVYDWRTTLTFVHEAGALLKLYFDQVNMVKVWQLLYSMATLASSVNFTVTAVAEILATNEEIQEEWLQKAKEYLNHPDLSMSVKSSFMISSANHYLKNCQIAEGLNLLSTLEPSAIKNSIQYTDFLITLGLYQKLTDWQKYNVTFSCSPSFNFSFHKAIGYLLYLAEHKKWGGFVEVCQVHQQLLKVSHLLGEVNSALEQPREARCYLKSSLPLAQKLALPLSTAQLVLILAWIDFNTGLIDDCAVKLQSLEDLLELCTTPPSYSCLGSSPSYSPSAKSVMTTPEYLSHPPNCINCLPCNNEEYKRLVLETITLRAAFCAEFGSHSHAHQCFQVAIQVAEDLGPSRSGEVVMSQARLWLRYATVMIRSKKMKEAASANAEAVRLLSVVDETILTQLVLEQKRIIEFSLLEFSFMPRRLFVEIENIETPKKTASTISPAKTFSTPKNNLPVGKSPLATISNNEPITPFARRSKIPFMLPSSGEENTPPTHSLTKSNRTSKLPQKLVVETPVTRKKAVNATPTHSENKSKTKSKALPKFLLETPNPIKSAVKGKKKPLTLYDDEGSVSLSETNNSSAMKDKQSEEPRVEHVCKDAVSSKKVLFPQSGSHDFKDISEDFASLSIVRKAKKVSGMKTYGKSNLEGKKEPEFKHPGSSSLTRGSIKKTVSSTSSEKGSSSHETKKVIDDVETLEEPVRKVSLRRGASANDLKKQTSKSKLSSSEPLEEKTTRSCNIPKEDCDIVEGTPSPPGNNRFRMKVTRKARSNKS